MLYELFPTQIYEVLSRYDDDRLTEIRVRADKPVVVLNNGARHFLYDGGNRIIAERELIAEIIRRATYHSLYSYSDHIAEGYIPYKGGIRIGLTGLGFSTEDGKFLLDEISSLNIRVPHQLKGVAKAVFGELKAPENCLICGRPHSGKTTLIRDMLRVFSDNGHNCLVIDQRSELAAVHKGIMGLDVGDNTDVLTNVKRGKAVEIAIKNMNPDVIFMEELFDSFEIKTAIEAIQSGVKVIASLHAGSIRDIVENKKIGELLPLIDRLVLLDRDNVGKVLYNGGTNELFACG